MLRCGIEVMNANSFIGYKEIKIEPTLICFIPADEIKKNVI